ncbi:MAG: carboxypeptidase-like regulatory domain-containing protein [Planctomycetota bacterium]
MWSPRSPRRRELLLATASVAFLVGSLAALRDRGPSTRVEVRRAPARAEERPRETESTLSEIERARIRDAAAVSERPWPVGAFERSSGASAHGLLVLPGGFPDAASLEVHAWPVLDDGSGEFDDTGRAPFHRLAGSVDGRDWRFDALAPGRWVFVGRAEGGGRSALGLSAEVEILPETANGPIGIVLEEYTLEGRVVDRTGAPVEGITVLHRWTPTDWRTATVAPARVRIGDRDETLQELREAMLDILVDAADIEPFMAMVDDEMLAAFADRRATRPVGDAAAEEEWVHSLTEAWSAHLAPDLQAPDAAHAASTDERGAFRARFDGPGVVELWVAPPVDPTSDDGRRWITVEASEELVASGARVVRDVVLERAARIDGTVLYADGRPAEESYAFVLPLGGGLIDVPGVDREGRFVSRDVKPGKYLVGANEDVPGAGWLTWCETVEVQGGAEIEVEGALTAAGTIRGVVVDAEGRPHEGVELLARGVDVDHMARSATSDAFGRFEFHKLYAWRFSIEGVEREVVGSTDVDLRDGARDVDVGRLVAQ